MLHEGAKIRYSNIEALAPMNVIILEKDVAMYGTTIASGSR